MKPFADRFEAGRMLAARLRQYAGRADAVVLALPRGGIPVAVPIAQSLRLALDVLPVRKLGLPYQGEFAIGAVARGGVRVLGAEGLACGLSAQELDRVTARELQKLERIEAVCRAACPARPLRGQTALLVDDGLATGCTMRAALAAACAEGAVETVIAVPVGARDSCAALAVEADRLVCLESPEPFRAVGCWYRDFSQVSDAQAQQLLRRALHP